MYGESFNTEVDIRNKINPWAETDDNVEEMRIGQEGTEIIQD